RKAQQGVNQNMMNKEIEKTIRELKTAKKRTGQPIWGALAEELDKPKRVRVDVNLSRINRLTKEGEVAAVPGKVLATGKLEHPVTVAAYSFSDAAKEKIAAAGGEAKTLSQLAAEGVEPSKVKLIK
ncbi:MAG: 50S ribosomal protein L18e, partial [Candidatus Bathyarchaeota archaeon]|nr:50S ribosomal protein L18e [Candidatus Bathyarchaeota archaeon]